MSVQSFDYIRLVHEVLIQVGVVTNTFLRKEIKDG